MFIKLIKHIFHKDLNVRPGADQSSKAVFGKALLLKHARTCFLLLKIWLAYTNRAKSKSTFEHVWHVQRTTCFLLKRAKTCSKAFLLFARLMCASRIFNKRKHVLAKALLPKAALLDWSASKRMDKPLLPIIYAYEWQYLVKGTSGSRSMWCFSVKIVSSVNYLLGSELTFCLTASRVPYFMFVYVREIVNLSFYCELKCKVYFNKTITAVIIIFNL